MTLPSAGSEGRPEPGPTGPPPRLPDGPHAWRNWQAMAAGQPARYRFEVAIHTNVHVRGESVGKCGPYDFINMLSSAFAGRRTACMARIALRASYHLDDDAEARRKADARASFTGGGIS